MVGKLKKYVQISGTLTCKTGLRIGGSKDDIEIGGMDNPILRHPITKEPYIPGSSIKGKIRSLLEYKEEKISGDGEPCNCGKEDCLICRVFGPHKNVRHNLGPSRLIMRDATVKTGNGEGSISWLKKTREEGLQYAEVKTENIIDRRTGVARSGGLRTQERIPAGTKFDLRMSVRIFEGDDEDKILNFIKEGLDLLQKDYLGGSGTRGYGEVEIVDLKCE